MESRTHLIERGIRVGISGWRYKGWRGSFYPPGLRQHSELSFAAEHFSTIEINGSFYSLQRPESYKRWYAETPKDFIFSVKGPRFITHLKKLLAIEVPLANFYASGVLALREKLGPFLWQFPPQMSFNAERYEHFFKQLPRTTSSARRLARRHDSRLVGRAYLERIPEAPLRHAVEIRSESFRTPEFVDLLVKYDVALVVADTAGRWPLMEDITSNFVYIRLHGDEELYVSGYSPAALKNWARKINRWSAGDLTPKGEMLQASSSYQSKREPQGKDVFVYFDNDAKVYAPYDAMQLMKTLSTKGGVAGRQAGLGSVREQT